MSATQLVKGITDQIQTSLSALIDLEEAIDNEVAIATMKLALYEEALGITADPSAPFSERVKAVKEAAEREVIAALPQSSSELEIANLSLEGLRRAHARAGAALQKLTNLSAIINDEALSRSPATRAAIPVATPEGTYCKLQDNREGFQPHSAYLFRVEASKGTVYQELLQLLGQRHADQLVSDWLGICNLHQRTEATEVALFLDSNNKARNDRCSSVDATTTQERDFHATNRKFADDLAATLLCARILRKYMDQRQLSEGENDLFCKLTDGRLRSLKGEMNSIVVHGLADLRAYSSESRGHGKAWALGSPLS